MTAPRARGSRGAGTLFAATDGHPARSARYREFLAPQGYGDELRAVFRLGNGIWGVLDVFRERGRAPFSEREVDLIAGIGPALAAALRAGAVNEPTPSARTTSTGPAPRCSTPPGPCARWMSRPTTGSPSWLAPAGTATSCRCSSPSSPTCWPGPTQCRRV